MSNVNVRGVASLDSSGWDATMGAMTRSAGSLASHVKSQFGAIGGMVAGAFTVGAITSQISKTIEYAGTISDLSKRTGITTDTLQEMDYWLKQNGSSLDAAVTGITFLSRAMSEASINAKTGIKNEVLQAFEFFGITIEQVKAKKPEEIFKQIAQQAGVLGDSADKTNAILQLLGRGAMEMLPAMKAGFSEAADEAEKLGLVIKGDVIKTLDDAGDQIDAFMTKVKTFTANTIAEPLTVAKKDDVDKWQWVLSKAMNTMDYIGQLIDIDPARTSLGSRWSGAVQRAKQRDISWQIDNAPGGATRGWVTDPEIKQTLKQIEKNTASADVIKVK